MEAADEERPLLNHRRLPPQPQDECSRYTSDGTVDIYRQPALKRSTGNWRACVFILAQVPSSANACASSPSPRTWSPTSRRCSTRATSTPRGMYPPGSAPASSRRSSEPSWPTLFGGDTRQLQSSSLSTSLGCSS
uniref:Uncharacterized protein n=1 Tax=Aegilops tauschii subsp. strangulata TaxID=200361 RepID=A0A453SGJ8_AEGTS